MKDTEATRSGTPTEVDPAETDLPEIDLNGLIGAANAGLRGLRERLRQQEELFASALGATAERCTELENGVADLSRRHESQITTLNATVANMTQQHESHVLALEARVADLAEQLGALRNDARVLRRLYEAAERGSDSGTQLRTQHLDLAAEFGHVVDQDFVHVARQTAADERMCALAVADLCRAVFQGPPSTRHVLTQLPKALRDIPGVDDAVRRALAVRARAEEADSATTWDFDAPLGVLPTPDQAIWRSGRAADLIEFVVAPGYRVGAQLFRLQVVFTASTNAIRNE